MSFPRYPRYKDSGVEWLGEVPEHWEVKRLRYLSIVRKGRLPSGTSPMPSADTDMPYLSMEYLRGETDTPSFVPVSQNLLRAESGDLLLLWDGSNAGEFLRAKQGVVSSTVALIEPRNVDREFLFFACKARERQLKDQTVGMGIPHVSGDELRDFLIPCPPLPEQTAIAEFLDRETGKIDELVAEQRRLMELLKEKRQAVISHAVTRGLNPAAPLKPSGIEWLGDVPAHWTVRRVKSVSTFITSGPRGWSERVGEIGPLFVQSGDLNDSLQVEFATAKRVQIEDDAEATRTRLRDGDVVVCITGAKTGNVAVCASVPELAYVNQHLCLVRPSAEVLPLFLGVVLKSRAGQTYFELSQYGLKQGLSLEDVKEAPVFLPLITEQKAITGFVESESAKFDTLTAEAQRAIDLLQERRTALISAAVTGQIDVRHVRCT
jgi:type I restriction enzyme S subunit